MSHPPFDQIHLGPGRMRVRTNGRNGSAEAARVGLSGSLEGASQGQEGGGPAWSPRKLWADTRSTWSGFVRVLGLVWEAHPGLTVALALLNVFQGVLPAARVWLAKLLIDEVVLAVTGGTGLAALPTVAWLVFSQFAIGAAGSFAQTLANISQQLLQ